MIHSIIFWKEPLGYLQVTDIKGSSLVILQRLEDTGLCSLLLHFTQLSNYPCWERHVRWLNGFLKLRVYLLHMIIAAVFPPSDKSWQLDNGEVTPWHRCHALPLRGGGKQSGLLLLNERLVAGAGGGGALR